MVYTRRTDAILKVYTVDLICDVCIKTQKAPAMRTHIVYTEAQVWTLRTQTQCPSDVRTL